LGCLALLILAARVSGGPVVAIFALLDRVAADQLVEQAVLRIDQRQLRFVELLEELLPADLDQAAVMRIGIVRGTSGG
jgi:hypothetical protein